MTVSKPQGNWQTLKKRASLSLIAERKEELSTDTSKCGEALDNKIEGVLAKSLPMLSVKPKTDFSLLS